jgi:hypothetical protein
VTKEPGIDQDQSRATAPADQIRGNVIEIQPDEHGRVVPGIGSVAICLFAQSGVQDAILVPSRWIEHEPHAGPRSGSPRPGNGPPYVPLVGMLGFWPGPLE